VAYNTGMRLGELRHLQWGHIDREKGFIRLPADLTKEGRDKTIPMNHHVRRVLADLPRALAHDFVFTYSGKPILSHRRDAERPLRRLVRRLA
jgi:integrase